MLVPAGVKQYNRGHLNQPDAPQGPTTFHSLKSLPVKVHQQRWVLTSEPTTCLVRMERTPVASCLLLPS